MPTSESRMFHFLQGRVLSHVLPDQRRTSCTATSNRRIVAIFQRIVNRQSPPQHVEPTEPTSEPCIFGFPTEILIEIVERVETLQDLFRLEQVRSSLVENTTL